MSEQPINPRLFLTLAIRQLEEAKRLEATPDYQDTVKGYKILLSLVKYVLSLSYPPNTMLTPRSSLLPNLPSRVFIQTFGLPGPNGQDRLTPLDDKLVLLQLAEVCSHFPLPLGTSRSLFPVPCSWHPFSFPFLTELTSQVAQEAAKAFDATART
jgi:hypothetical protein